MKRTEQQGFTLIELLTVMAISAVLLTIIVVPVFQTFNFTRSAQAFNDAQDRARIVADRISREIGNAVSVRNTNILVQSTLNGKNVSLPANSVVISVPKIGSQTNQNAGYIEVVLPYVKMDLVKPAEGDASLSNLQINPTNGFTDPTIVTPHGQPVLPVAPGATIIRYFVGLHNPFGVYTNPYDGILMSRSGNRDNLFVLYRAEVQPYIHKGGKYVPNDEFFQADSATGTQIVDYDDPRFFLNDGAPNIGVGQTKQQRISNWLSKAVIQTEISRYDMIQPVYDKFSHQVTYAGDAPQIVPLIQFRPSHMSNDAAQGQVASRQGEETDNGAAIGPDVFKTQYALWSNHVIRVWPQGWSPSGAGFNQYFVARNDVSNGNAGAPPGYSIYYYDPAISPTDYNSGTEVFDMFTYESVTANQGAYPFSQAVTAANNRSNWLATQTIKDRFTPFDVNTGKGKIITSAGIDEVGDPTQTPPVPQNLPTVLTSPAGYGPYSAINDPGRVPFPGSNPVTYYIPGNFYDPAFDTVNERFNWTYNNAPNIASLADRFIDLRVTNQSDGSVGPMNPTKGFAKARIVPGSDVVYGPDQLPGPNYGNTIRYVRTTHAPGPNQYQINYVDQPEPRTGSGPVDYTLIGLTAAQIGNFNPAVYDPQNFVSAVIQPRFKKGYLRFNSDPNVPLPLGQIQIAYRFQFNGTETGPATPGVYASDVFAVDYDTRQLMSVVLTIRNYPQTTNIPNPQTVTVKATANLRNVIR